MIHRVYLSDFAKKFEARPSTIKWYCEIGLLPSRQDGRGLRRYFVEEDEERMWQIIAWKHDRHTIEEILEMLETWETMGRPKI